MKSTLLSVFLFVLILTVGSPETSRAISSDAASVTAKNYFDKNQQSTKWEKKPKAEHPAAVKKVTKKPAPKMEIRKAIALTEEERTALHGKPPQPWVAKAKTAPPVKNGTVATRPLNSEKKEQSKVSTTVYPVEKLATVKPAKIKSAPRFAQSVETSPVPVEKKTRRAAPAKEPEITFPKAIPLSPRERRDLRRRNQSRAVAKSTTVYPVDGNKSEAPEDFAHLLPIFHEMEKISGNEHPNMEYVRKLMAEGRKIPYAPPAVTQYWKPKSVREMDRSVTANCLDKAVWLANKMNDPSIQLVVGTPRTQYNVLGFPRKSHAWLRWQNGGKWWILDCTRRKRPVRERQEGRSEDYRMAWWVTPTELGKVDGKIKIAYSMIKNNSQSRFASNQAAQRHLAVR